jgi:hypothetical protein
MLTPHHWQLQMMDFFNVANVYQKMPYFFTNESSLELGSEFLQ